MYFKYKFRCLTRGLTCRTSRWERSIARKKTLIFETIFNILIIKNQICGKIQICFQKIEMKTKKIEKGAISRTATTATTTISRDFTFTV